MRSSPLSGSGMLDSPAWRIAAVTGEEPNDVLTCLGELGLLGYTADDIWTLLRQAISASMSCRDLVNTLGPKENSWPTR